MRSAPRGASGLGQVRWSGFETNAMFLCELRSAHKSSPSCSSLRLPRSQENYGGGKTIYDFDVMIGGKTVPFAEAIGVKRGTRTKVTTKVRYDKPTEEGGEPVKIEENVEETEEVRRWRG